MNGTKLLLALLFLTPTMAKADWRHYVSGSSSSIFHGSAFEGAKRKARAEAAFYEQKCSREGGRSYLKLDIPKCSGKYICTVKGALTCRGGL